uniref:Transmembrane protein 186 n=1 Tax=Graphocephala atropunctata TaxID=36148 RepID=A0A1B6MF37_9HEMI
MFNYLTCPIQTTLCKGTFIRLIQPVGSHIIKHKHLFGKVLSVKLSHTDRQFAKEAVVESDAYREIYRFPAIRIGYTMQKLKWYQTLLTGASIPTSSLLYFGGLIDSSWVFTVIFSGLLVTLNIYGCAQLFNQSIGFMYLSKDETNVKISYLDYWGKRVDMEVPLDDVVPLSEVPRPLTDRFFKQIVFYSTDQLKLKLYLHHGKVTDRDGFVKTFGSSEID